MNPLKSWRTTSLGLTSIAGAVVNLVFAMKHQVDDQSTWMIAITQILSGMGLIFAGDQASSKANHDDSIAQIDDLKFKVAATATAVKTGSTDILEKANVPTIKDPSLLAPVAITLPKP